MDNKFFIKRIAVKGRSIFSQNHSRRLATDITQKIRSIEDKYCQMNRQRSNRSPIKKLLSNLKSINKRNNTTNVYKCRYIGCGKIFLNKNCWTLHQQKQHSLIIKDSRKTSLTKQIDEIKDSLIGQPSNESPSHVSTTDPTDEPIDPTFTVSSHGFSSSKKVKMHFTTDDYLGQKRCICDFCGHKTYGIKSSSRMAVHINGKHLRNQTFKCEVKGCNKEFYAPNSLRYHKMNHLCGFGIKNGKTLTTVCGNQSINRYRKRIDIKGLRFFKCIFNECQYITKGSAIKRHIHDQHLCPNRVSFPKKDLTVNSIDIYNRFDDFCQMIESDGQQLYKCKGCQFFTEKMIGFLSHIKLKHFASNQNNFEEMSTSSSTQHLSQKIDPLIDSEETEEEEIEDNEENSKNRIIRVKKLKKRGRKKKKKKNEPIWKPFNCHYCYQSFDDLLFLRNHLKTHNN